MPAAATGPPLRTRISISKASGNGLAEGQAEDVVEDVGDVVDLGLREPAERDRPASARLPGVVEKGERQLRLFDGVRREEDDVAPVRGGLGVPGQKGADAADLPGPEERRLSLAGDERTGDDADRAGRVDARHRVRRDGERLRLPLGLDRCDPDGSCGAGAGGGPEGGEVDRLAGGDDDGRGGGVHVFAEGPAVRVEHALREERPGRRDVDRVRIEQVDGRVERLAARTRAPSRRHDPLGLLARLCERVRRGDGGGKKDGKSAEALRDSHVIHLWLGKCRGGAGPFAGRV